MKLTLGGRRFKLQLERARPARAGEAEPWSGAPDETSVSRVEDRVSLSVPAETPESTQTSPVIPDPRPRQEQAAPREARRKRPADSFWDVLDPTEREALRAVASLRTFAAGARLMEEGGRADHVLVILGGQAKICVDENGTERVLAIRGLGQLVGERAALEISVRSATVIALDMIWALVVQTKDSQPSSAPTPASWKSCRISSISGAVKTQPDTGGAPIPSRPGPPAARPWSASWRMTTNSDIHADAHGR